MAKSKRIIKPDESQKKRILRSLFAIRLHQKRLGHSPSMIVTLGEIQKAIERANKRWKALDRPLLSTGNPANFFKDIVRREQSYRIAWPSSVLNRGFIGFQVKGGKDGGNGVARTPRIPTERIVKGEGPCFEFVQATTKDPIGDLYQQVPVYQRPDSTGTTRIFDIQTLELPPEVRRLQRDDETFLLQLIVRLRVIETHLGVVSAKGLQSLIHLQIGLKLRGAEIDALFLGDTHNQSGHPTPQRKTKVLVALEAKGKYDDILKSQIEDQATALFGIDAFKDEVDLVVPMAAKLVGPSRIYVVEYRFVERNGSAKLCIESEAFYDLAPPIGGLG